MPVSLLELERVTKRFRDGAREILVLDQVSLRLQAGESVGIVGERRSGKTTLLRIAAGVEHADSGTVWFDGSRLGASTEPAYLSRHGGIALMRGDWRPSPGMQTLEQVARPLMAEGASDQDANEAARQALAQAGVETLAFSAGDSLALAERMRVGLALALARKPRVLLIDEPALLRAPGQARELYALLRGLPGRLGLGMIIASEEISALAGLSHLLSLSDGRLVSSRSGEADVIPFPSAGQCGKPEGG
jgi:predicted ABC-type transport system involved in lysophospholipase L1 biosynthesis ATPase subunit